MRKILSLSQSDISVDRRLTVGTPSGFNAKSLLKRLSVAALFLFAFMGNAWAETITSVANIESGKRYYIRATKSDNTDWYLSVAGHGEAGTGLQGTAVSDAENADVFTFTKSGNNWTIQFANGNYLSLANSKANGKVNVQTSSAAWTITDVSNKNLINLKINNHCLQRNTSSSTNFGSYSSGQLDVWLESVGAAKPGVSVDQDITGGSVSVSGADDLSAVEPGTELTVTATPDASHKNPVVTITKDEDSSDVTELYNATTGKFLMPSYSITVSASFTAKAQSAVTVTNPDHGTITVSGAANLSSVMEGTELTIEVEGSGYTFTPKAYKTGDENTEVAISEGTLTMPAFPITITADETEITTATITLSEDALDFASVAKGAAVPAAKTFTIDGVHLTGDLALAWDAEGDDAFTYEITAGSLTATDGAVSATVAVTPNSTATAGSFANTLTVSGGGAATQEVLVGFDVLETYTATWHVNGAEVKTQTAVAGTTLEFPANPTTLAGKSFVGWATAEIVGETDTKPAFFEDAVMPANDVTLYAVFADGEAASVTKTTDELNYSFVGVEGTNYTEWDSKTGTSGAVYAGQSAGGNNSIQLRSNNSNSGIITTSTGAGKVTKVTVTWNTNTAASRTLDIYGKNSAYENATDLYDNSKQGTKLGSVVNGTSTELEITEDYEYIGLRSASGAMYIDAIEVEWTLTKEATYSAYATTQYAVNFEAPKNGTLAVKNGEDAITSGDKFWSGTELTVVATPAASYKLVTLTANGEPIEENKIIIGTKDINVVAAFEIATALDNTAVEGKAVKSLQNGMLIIEKAGVRYNVMGQVIR